MKNLTGTDNLIKAFEEANNIHKHFTSTGVLKAIAEIQKKIKQNAESSLHKTINEMHNTQKHFASSGVLKAISDLQKMCKQSVESDILNTKEYFTSTDVLKTIAETQKMCKQNAESSMLKAVADANRVQKHIATSALKTIADLQLLNDQFKSLNTHKTFIEVQNAYKHFASSGIENTISIFQNTFKKHIPWTSLLNTAFRISDIATSIGDMKFTINSIGSISSFDKTVSLDQIEKISISCIKDSELKNEQISPEIRLDNFLNSILSQHPLVQKIFTNILLPVLLSYIFSNNPTTIINNKSINIKLLKKEINILNVDNAFYKNYRIVSINALSVRDKNSKKGKLISQLHFGQIVRILLKKKEWTLIEYNSLDGNNKIYGWVLTRYIKRID